MRFAAGVMAVMIFATGCAGFRRAPVADAAKPVDEFTTAPPAIAVTNFCDGETIRYPTPLLRGALKDADATTITIINTSSRRPTREIAGVARHGQFRGLTELLPGENQLLLRCGEATAKLRLTYEPQTNPYFIRMIYATDNSGDTAYQSPLPDDPQNYREKIDAAMKLLQAFTAESMNDAGHGRRTFNLELDAAGKVVVHTFKGARPKEYYYQLGGVQWYARIQGELARPHPTRMAKNVVIAAYTRFDPDQKKVFGHTALGGGGLGLFGSAGMYTWPNDLQDVFRAFGDGRPVDPSKVHDDSAFRRTFWGTASTTIGAVIHETGHTFGLAHVKDGRGIMARGFDRLNRVFTLVEPPPKGQRKMLEFTDDQIARWSLLSAAFLRHSRWFALDDRADWVSLDAPRQLAIVRDDDDPDQIVVASPHGVQVVVFRTKGNAVDYVDCHDQAQALERVTFSITEWRERLKSAEFEMQAIDSQGRIAFANQSTLDRFPGDFVRAWRFSPVTKPWAGIQAFATVTAEDHAQIVAQAKQTKLIKTKTPYVDFLPHFPLDQRGGVAGYALRTLRVDEPTTLTLLTGSDDALRVWLNGRVVTEKLAFRAALMDQDRTTLQLQVGENALLVEVSQGAGGWGLFLRLEDAAGHKLRLDDEGRLASIEP